MEELIEASELVSLDLLESSDTWLAFSMADSTGKTKATGHGKTPSEAVAKLWLNKIL